MSQKIITDEDSKYRDAFEFFDADGNGSISSDEIASAMRLLGHNPTNADIRKAIQKVDMDGNGVLDFNEFCAIMTELPTKKDEEKNLRKAFKEFDLNQDGTLSKDEFEYFLLNLGDKLTLNEVDALFEDLDTDKNGLIDINEFIELMNKFKK